MRWSPGTRVSSISTLGRWVHFPSLYQEPRVDPNVIPSPKKTTGNPNDSFATILTWVVVPWSVSGRRDHLLRVSFDSSSESNPTCPTFLLSLWCPPCGWWPARLLSPLQPPFVKIGWKFQTSKDWPVQQDSRHEYLSANKQTMNTTLFCTSNLPNNSYWMTFISQ